MGGLFFARPPGSPPFFLMVWYVAATDKHCHMEEEENVTHDVMETIISFAFDCSQRQTNSALSRICESETVDDNDGGFFF